MGTEYNLYNHINCTYYDLGKGPWCELLEKSAWTLYDVEILELELRNICNPTFEGNIEYFKTLSKDLCRFVGDTPEDMLQIIGDGFDEHWQARSLGYVCTGSRYDLDDPQKNKEHVDTQNAGFKTELDPADVETLRTGKWNFSKHMLREKT
jgi:hypothetical protein